MTKICVISDTHENEKAITRAVVAIKKAAPNLVLHLGDIVSPLVLNLFADLPMRFLYGNNDGERDGLREACERRGWKITDYWETQIDGKFIFSAHGHRPDWRLAMKSGAYDYIFSGHTHAKIDEVVGRTRHINPGALFRVSQENPYTCVILDVGTGKIQWIYIDRI